MSIYLFLQYLYSYLGTPFPDPEIPCADYRENQKLGLGLD